MVWAGNRGGFFFFYVQVSLVLERHSKTELEIDLWVKNTSRMTLSQSMRGS